MKTVLHDTRRIVSLTVHQREEYYTNPPSPYYTCGNCDRIVAYEEPGETVPQVWFAVYKGDQVWRRVSGKNITVEYGLDMERVDDAEGDGEAAKAK